MDKRKINYNLIIKEKIKSNRIFLTREETIIENQILKEISKSNGIYVEEEKVDIEEKNKVKNNLLNQMKN